MPSGNPTICGSIAGKPGVFGVAMHTAAYRALGLDWVYVAFGTDDTAAAVAAMRRLGIRGLGVPMPMDTRSLRDGRARGCTAVPGVRMQLHQAAEQIRLYTTRDPDLAVMEEALRGATATAKEQQGGKP